MRGADDGSTRRGAELMDAVDERIVLALQRDGREPFRRIAERVGVSEATVRARYARLTHQNLLRVTGVTNPLVVGLDGMATVAVRVSGAPEPVAEEIAGWPETTSVVITAGQFDILAEIACKDRGCLLGITNRIRALPSVASTESFLHLDVRKRFDPWGEHVGDGRDGQ